MSQGINLEPDFKAIRRNLLFASLSLTLFTISDASVESILGITIKNGNLIFIIAMLVLLIYENARFIFCCQSNNDKILRALGDDYSNILLREYTTTTPTDYSKDVHEKSMVAFNKTRNHIYYFDKNYIFIKTTKEQEINGVEIHAIYKIEGIKKPLWLLSLKSIMWWEYAAPVYLSFFGYSSIAYLAYTRVLN